MKKIISTAKGAVINFRASGNRGGGGLDDKSEGGSGTVYRIDNKGIMASEDHVLMMQERLGSQIQVVEPSEEDIAPKNEDTDQPVLGAACMTDDDEEGTWQEDGEGGLVCKVVEA